MEKHVAFVSVLVLSGLTAVTAGAAEATPGVGEEPYPFRCDKTPAQHQAANDYAMNVLQEEGFTVEKGTLTFKHEKQFDANPSTLYGIFQFGATPFFTLDKADALIFFGCTPPPMRYFSYTPYVFTTPELNRTIIFASLEDSLNPMTIRTSLTTLAPFSSTTLLIMTASANTDGNVRSVYEHSVVSSAINTLVVSQDLVKLGTNPLTASGLALLGRVAIYDNETECNLYTNTTFPIFKVSRVRTMDRMFDTPLLRPRFSGNSEADLETTLAELAIAVTGNISAKGYRVAYEGRIPMYPLDGRECIATGKDCLADCPDSAYFADLREYRLGSEDSKNVYAIIGVDHHKLGYATYSNFALDPYLAVTDDQYGDSAARYLPNTEGIENFFAFTIKRKCDVDEFYCLSISTDIISPSDEFRFISRVYLNPKTGTGPAYNETITNYLLLFVPE